MALQHNYIQGVGRKPTQNVIRANELVINETDGTLWSKNNSNDVFQVGSSATPSWSLPANLRPPTNTAIDTPLAVERESRLKYQMLDADTVLISGAVWFYWFQLNSSWAVFTLPSHISNRIHSIRWGVCQGMEVGRSNDEIEDAFHVGWGTKFRAYVETNGNVVINYALEADSARKLYRNINLFVSITCPLS